MFRKIRIAPCLWFYDQAEEAAKYYCGIFRNSRISWQVVPSRMQELVEEGGARGDRVMSAALRMKKLDLGALERAAGG